MKTVPAHPSLTRALRLLWLAAVVTVSVASLAPTAAFPESLVTSHDKLEHLLAYSALSFLPVLTESRRRFTACIVFAAALGVCLEYLQNFSPGRSFEYSDIATNFAGLLTGFLLALPFRRGWLWGRYSQ